MHRWKLIVISILVLIVVIIMFQNTESVVTHLLFFTVNIPQALLLLATFLIGLVAGAIAWGIVRRRS